MTKLEEKIAKRSAAFEAFVAGSISRPALVSRVKDTCLSGHVELCLTCSIENKQWNEFTDEEARAWIIQRRLQGYQ